jgi:hypothetical protein
MSWIFPGMERRHLRHAIKGLKESRCGWPPHGLERRNEAVIPADLERRVTALQRKAFAWHEVLAVPGLERRKKAVIPAGLERRVTVLYSGRPGVTWGPGCTWSGTEKWNRNSSWYGAESDRITAEGLCVTWGLGCTWSGTESPPQDASGQRCPASRPPLRKEKTVSKCFGSPIVSAQI